MKQEIKNRKGMSGVEGGKGICYQWKEKGQCSKGDRCSFRCHELEVSRGKRGIRGRSKHGDILRQPCRYYLKGTCTRSPCEYWHPPSVNSTKTETVCKARDKCLFPHHKVDEQPNKKPKKGNYAHRRRESDDKNAVAIVKIVPKLGCVSQDSDALVSQRGKQSQGNPMQEVLGSIRKIKIHSVYATSNKYPGKQRTIARKNTSQNFSSATSQRYEI